MPSAPTDFLCGSQVSPLPLSLIPVFKRPSRCLRGAGTPSPGLVDVLGWGGVGWWVERTASAKGRLGTRCVSNCLRLCSAPGRAFFSHWLLSGTWKGPSLRGNIGSFLGVR